MTLRPLLLSVLATGLQAQATPQWGNLEPGPYGVGVRVINAYDSSRTWWPPVDWRGVKRQGESARPVQIVLWYPIARGSGEPRMRYGDYLDFWATELGPRSDELKTYKMNEYRRGPFSPLYPQGMPDSVWARITAVPTAARKDAPPARETFPLLIQSGIGGPSAQSVMHEYLASHGYVIASTPFLNTSPAWHDRGEWTAAALDEEVRDIGFVYTRVGGLPFVDRNRTAVIGMGGHAGVFFQMRTGLLQAVALLDASFPEAARRLPYFDPVRVRIPLLDLPNTEYPRGTWLLDSLPYAPRFLVRARELPHVDFYQFRRIGSPETARDQRNYEVISRYARAFLDHTLKGDTTGLRFLQASAEANGLPPGFLTVAHEPARPPVPTEAEFLTLVRYQGIDSGVAVYREVKGRDPAARLFSIDGLRTVSFFLVRDHGPQAATRGFDLIAEEYPDSARVQKQLGDWYLRGNLRDQAMKFYETALSKLPNDTSLSAREKEQLEREIRERLHSLDPSP